jgi:hypothetical protein
MNVASTILKRTITCCIPVLMVMASCIPDPLEVDGLPAVKPQIVVSTQIIPDQTLVVLLTKTFSALDASEDSDPQEVLNQIAVTDATVTITGPTGANTLLSLGNGFYGGIAIAFVPGQEYSLDIKSESLGQVSATTIVKPQVTFDDISAELFYNGFNDTLAQITYRINDPAEKNWYMLNVQEFEQNELAENVLNPNAFMRMLDDAPFNGQAFTETFRVFPRDFAPGDTIAVFLSNVSEQYYDFLELRIDNRFSFIEYLSEPVNYPSNVKGGRGFFNLYLPDVRLFVLE